MIIAILHIIRSWLARPIARWSILGAYLVLLALLHRQNGVLLDKEAEKYVGCAVDVLHGDLHDLLGNYLKYGSYVLFLVPFAAIGLPAAAVLVQIVLMVFAGLALDRLVVRIADGSAWKNLVFALFLLCPFIQAWTLSLYTEAFFTSISILFIERITRPSNPRGLNALLAVATVFARPVGLFFVGGALLWNATEGLQKRLRIIWRWTGCAAILLFAIGLPGIRPAQLAPIVNAQIIAGIPLDAEVPASFVGSSILDAQVFLLHRLTFGEWIGLAGRRIASLFTPTRPYFSPVHNVVNGLLYPLFPLAVLGLWKHRASSVVRLTFAILVVNTLLIGLTHDEWSGRFLVPLLPLLMLLAVVGLVRVRKVAPMN